MVKRRATSQEIGVALNITRERIRQLIKSIAKKYGKRIFDLDEPLRTTREVAKKLGVSDRIIGIICSSGKIPCHKRSESKKSTWLIGKIGMKMLKQHPLVTGKRECVICKKTFIYKDRLGGRRTCSDICLKKHQKRQYDACIKQ